MQGLSLADVCITWQAVDKLELRHLVNCLVFPQLGMRSHANETSGGDLDGTHSHVALGLARGVYRQKEALIVKACGKGLWKKMRLSHAHGVQETNSLCPGTRGSCLQGSGHPWSMSPRSPFVYPHHR